MLGCLWLCVCWLLLPVHLSRPRPSPVQSVLACLLAEYFDAWDAVVSGRAAAEATAASAADLEACLLADAQLEVEAAEVRCAGRRCAGRRLLCWRDEAQQAPSEPHVCRPLVRPSLPVLQAFAAAHGEPDAAAAHPSDAQVRRCWRVYARRLQADASATAQAQALLGGSLDRLACLLADRGLPPAFPAAIQVGRCAGWARAGQRVRLRPASRCAARVALLAGFLRRAGHPCPPDAPPPSSPQAAAALYAGRKQAGIAPAWPSALRRLTGYDEEAHPQARGAV